MDIIEADRQFFQQLEHAISFIHIMLAFNHKVLVHVASTYTKMQIWFIHPMPNMYHVRLTQSPLRCSRAIVFINRKEFNLMSDKTSKIRWCGCGGGLVVNAVLS